MTYEEALLKALKVRSGKTIQKSTAKRNKYWRKLIKVELERIRADRMTDPWINSALRNWLKVDKWDAIRINEDSTIIQKEDIGE